MAYTKKLPKIISEDDLRLLQQSIMDRPSNTFQDEFLKWRDWTSIALMYYTGLRPAECLQLKWQDIDFEDSLIQIKPYINKRKNNLPAILTEPAKKMLLKYREIFSKYCPPVVEWIFPSTQSWNYLSVCSMDKRFLNYCKEIGIADIRYLRASGQPHYNISLYSLRHSFCTKVYKRTGSEIAVARLARHTQVASASIYTHLNFDDKKAIAHAVFG